MPRATTKEQLIRDSESNFDKLFTLIHSMTPFEQAASFAFEDRDKNIRDVLVHLYEWHQLLLNWVHSNQAGVKADFLPAPYNWKSYPQMNVEFWAKHQSTPLDDAVAKLLTSHADVMRLIESFTDEELFVKRHFPWTGTTNLGSYCISAAASHYDWAIRKIKKHQKSLPR